MRWFFFVIFVSCFFFFSLLFSKTYHLALPFICNLYINKETYMKYFTCTIAILAVILSTFSIWINDIHYLCDDDNLLTVVIMVKNEVDVIIPTLKLFVDAGITKFLVLDTGSSDGTQHKTEEYFKQLGLEHAYIIEEPFIDFAASRNRALDLAEQIFTHTTFFVMLDAEWYMHNVEGLITFCVENRNY